MRKTVGQIADRHPIGVGPMESVGSALTRIASRGWSAAPVVDESGHPVGMLSLRDIIGKGKGSVARDRMTTPPTVLPEDAEIDAAARLIAATGSSRLIVVDHEGRAVGVVSAVDVVRALVDAGQISTAA